MITYKLKIKNNINIDEYMKQYSSMLRKIYSNIELCEDTNFRKNLLVKYSLLDTWFYDTCKIEALGIYEKYLRTKESNIKKIDELKLLIKNNKFRTKKGKYKAINKLSYLRKNLDKSIVFGRKEILRNITHHKNIGNIELYNKFLDKFQINRIITIRSIGETLPYGNRKFSFDFINNIIIFKPNRNTRINVEYICKNKTYINNLNKLQVLTDNKDIPVSVRLDNKYVYVTFSLEKLNNYNFKEKEYFKELKTINKKDKELRKEIYIKWVNEQNDRKKINKLPNRYLGIDLNPEYIGFSILDKLSNNGEGEFKIIKVGYINLSHLNKSLRLSSTNIKEVYQNNKRKHEIKEAWKYIFNLCKHYKVYNIVIEDLNNVNNKIINENSKLANKKVKNFWHKALTEQLINKYVEQEGYNLIEVKPYHSSFIGNMIYSYADPTSASIEIGRRGIIKYLKNNSLYPLISRINSDNRQKYDLSENRLIGTSWKQLFNEISGLRYRNEYCTHSEINLQSNKSKVKFCIY